MQPKRRDTLLSVLGVVQYRKRSPRPADAELDAGTAETVIDTASESDNLLSVKSHVVHKASSELPKAARDSLEASSSQPLENQPEIESAVESEQQPEMATRQFDLLFWRCGNLLAVETSRDQQASVESKHRLTNNVFRAVFGADHKGSSMYSLSWPDVVSGAKQTVSTADSASEEWLRAFLKGQFSQDPQTRVWMMGDDVLELLLAKHGAKEEIEGVRLQDTELGMEVLVTPSLGAIIEKPYLKAGVWQLLRSLSV